MSDSLGNLLRVQGFRANLSVNGKRIELTDGDKSFLAIVSEMSVIDPDMPLGQDAREEILIQCLRDDVPEEIPAGLGTHSQVSVEVDGETLKLVKRQDTPSNPFVTFTAVKVPE